MLSSGGKYSQSWINTNEFVCKHSGELRDVKWREAKLENLECVGKNFCHGEDISSMMGAIRNNYQGEISSKILYDPDFDLANPHIVQCFIQTNASGK